MQYSKYILYMTLYIVRTIITYMYMCRYTYECHYIPKLTGVIEISPKLSMVLNF